MLGGLAPIMIFNFFELPPSARLAIQGIPVLSDIGSAIGMAPIPLYLDEKLTGLFISSESKNIDIETNVDTLKDADLPLVDQKGVNSSVTVSFFAKKSSIGLAVMLALADQIFLKLTSKTYKVSYLNGAVTVFNGLLHSLSVDSTSENDLYEIKMVLSRANNSTKLQVQIGNAAPLRLAVPPGVPAQ